MQKDSTIMLNTGARMPVLGLGTYQVRKHEAEKVVRFALDVGYRLIDTAALYGNECEVGAAIKASGIPREKIFVTTKLWVTDFLSPEAAFYKSLKKLGLDYIDLYLLHFPVPLLRARAWDKLETLYQKGLVKSIGVSNYSANHLQEVLSAARVVPAVNQVECSPFLYNKKLFEFCKSRNVVLEAYSPLTRGKKLNHPIFQKIAAFYGKTPAQVFIRWSLQHGTVVIPKSSDKKHLVENIDVFDFVLHAVDMAQLDALNINYHALWTPSWMS